MCSENQTDSTDSENDEGSEMTKEELERKVQEHMERRKSAYVKMGTVDEPRE